MKSLSLGTQSGSLDDDCKIQPGQEIQRPAVTGMIIQGRISFYHAIFLDNMVLLPFSISSCQIFWLIPISLPIKLFDSSTLSHHPGAAVGGSNGVVAILSFPILHCCQRGHTLQSHLWLLWISQAALKYNQKLTSGSKISWMLRNQINI